MIHKPRFYRSAAKATTYKLLATCATVTMALAATGSWKKAWSVGILDFVVKICLYLAHERAWARVEWGA